MSDELRKISPEELWEILAKHEAWLKGDAHGECADLRNTDLRRAYLSSTNLSHAQLNGANLLEANLLFANLSHANLRNSVLRSASLILADLRNADLSSADLSYTNLGGAKLGNTDLSFANLNCSNLNNAVLTSAKLNMALAIQSDFSLCDLTGANLENANLVGTCFHATSLSATKLQGADFTLAELTGSDLRGIEMDAGTRFIGTELGHCRFGKLGWRARFRLHWRQQGSVKKLLKDAYGRGKLKAVDWIKGPLPKPGSGPTGTTAFLGANFFAATVRDFDWGQADLSGATYETANDWGLIPAPTRPHRSGLLQKELERLRRYLDQMDTAKRDSFYVSYRHDETKKDELQGKLDEAFERLKSLLNQRLSDKEKLHAEAVRRERIDGGITAVSQSIQQTDADLRGNRRSCVTSQVGAYLALTAALLWGAVQHWDDVPTLLKPLHQQTAIQPEVDVNGRLNQLLQPPTTAGDSKPTALPPARSDGIAALLAQERLLALLWRISPSLLGFVLGVLLLRHHRQLLVHRGNLLAQKHALEKSTGILSAANYLIAPDDNYEAQMMKVFDNVQKSLLGGDKGGKTELEKDDDALPDPLAAARKYLSGKS